MTKQNINVQDGFLFQNLKDGSLLEIQLITGDRLSGRLKRFDRFAIVIENDGAEKLLYKHAIALISSVQTNP